MKLKEKISEELARIESQLTRPGAGSLQGEHRAPATQAQPTHVADVMNRGLVTVQPTDTVPTAARRLWQHGRTSLPVVDVQGRLVGLLVETDLLARLRSHRRAWWRGLLEMPADGATADHITTRALGSRRFEVTFSGPGGHSWSDYGVGNPIHALCRAVALFAETRMDSAPKSSVNVGLIEGGSGVNAIAQAARCKVDIRSESNARMEELVDVLAGAVERARDQENQRQTGGRVTVKTREIGSRPAAALPEQAPILRCVRAVDAHLGIRSHVDCSSTDANLPLSMGIPALAIGAGGQGGGAHTSAEWFSPEGRDLGLKRILLALLLPMRALAGSKGA